MQRSQTNYLGKIINYAYNKENVAGLGRCYTKTVDFPEGQDEKSYYNAFGWVVQTKAKSLNNKWIQKRFEYDAIGRKLRESEPYFSTVSPTQWTTFGYDQYGRLISQQSYTGNLVKTSFKGLSITVDDGVKSVTTTKDPMGNIVSVQDPGGTINYQYYGNGSMKLTNYDSHSVSITIDGWGRRTALNDPSAGNYTYSYNILGEILGETTPKGKTTYQYDAFGKLLTKQIVGDKTNLSLNYNYSGTTKLITSIDGQDDFFDKSHQYLYTYDNYKRPKIIKEIRSATQFEKQLEYDDFGRVIKESYISKNLNTGVNNQVSIKNKYDSTGILTEIIDFSSNQILWKVTDENARGQGLSIELGNGLVKYKQYDQYGFLTNITDKVNVTGGVQALKMDYSFNAKKGTLSSRKNYAFTNWNEDFTYDNLNRLTQISGANTHIQNYDNRGRITNNSYVGTYVYNTSKKYQLAGIDLNNQGDLYYQNHSLQQISYNAFKKPIDIFEENKGRVSFEYGPMMNRTIAYYGGLEEEKEQRQFHKYYSSIIPVEIVSDNVNGSTKIITYIGGNAYTAPIAHIKQVGGTTSINEYHYLHRDYLGSILAISDSAGTVQEESQFGAWGVVDKFLDADGNTTFSHNSLLGRGFTGHEHFFEVSLIHMNGRMYDAQLGRFLSPDNFTQNPFNTQSFNRYGYVWNNPLSFSDATGEYFFLAIIGTVIGATIGAVTYVINAAIIRNWSWGGFAMSVLRGAFTGALTGAIAPGAILSAMFSNGFLGTVATGVLSSFLPAVRISIGDFSFSLSPSIAFGNAFSIGANFSVSYQDGNFNASAGFGVSFIGSAHATGKKGWEHRTSGSVGYNDGKFNASLYTTSFVTDTKTSQIVGGVSIGHGDWNLRYENDGVPFGGIGLGDGKDRFRTAAMSLSYKDYSIGFNIFTGDPELDKDMGITPVPNGEHLDYSKTKKSGRVKKYTGGEYSGENAGKYRLGALYGSYKGFRFGRNSEAIRHVIQNKVAHTSISYQPWFKVLND